MKRLTVIGAAAATAATVGVLVTAGPGAAQTSGLPTLTVNLTGKSISVGGDLVSGAVNVTSTTTAKDAEPTLFHLKPGVTADQVLAALPHAQDPNQVSPYGEIVYDADAPKGTSTQQTILPAGDYLALDTSGDPAKSPHAEFTIAASAAPAPLPHAVATVRAIDFGFRAPKTLRRGTVVRFKNDGFVVHMIDAIGAGSKKNAERISRLLRAGKDGKAQHLSRGFAGFMGPVSHGAVQQTTISARKGYYVFACFMPTQDGREHTRLGMTRVVRVK